MNKLDYPENIGKIFLRNLELQFLTDGIDEAFAGLLAAFSDPSEKKYGIKLKGCEVDVAGSTYTVAPGFIYLLGEVFKVDGHQINVAGGETAYFDIEESDFDSNWPAPIEGGTTHQTRKKRVVKLVKSANPPNDRMRVDAPNLSKKIMDAAHPTGHPVWFDPRLENKTIGDFFNGQGEGLEGERYEGWILLGVYNGTEDYIQKALVNRDLSDTDLDTVGKTHGAKDHTLIEEEMPAHIHGVGIRGNNSGSFEFGAETAASGSGNAADMSGLSSAYPLSEEKGGDEAHNNMQASIVACLIARKSDAAYYV